MRGRLATLTTAAAFVFAFAPAAAHETHHEIHRDKAIAVKAFIEDGEVFAYTPYEIYSPADPKIPYQKGSTDREGFVAFVPNTAGKWRLKVIDPTGHGLDIEVDTADVGVTSGGAVSTAAFVLRPVVGLLLIGAIFAGLFLLYRRKEAIR